MIYPTFLRFLYFLVFSFLLSSCGIFSEYADHVQREQSPLVVSPSQTGSLGVKNFFPLPDTSALASLIDLIRGAKKKIWIEIYTWTEKETLSAVIEAKKRGVNVQVILEGSVYNTPYINNQTVSLLKEANIPVVYADNRRYTFTHAKVWIIDNLWCVATGNLSYSTFTKNRDFIVCSEDEGIREDLEEIFVSDFSHVRPFFSGGLDDRIGLSPENMREQIEKYIRDTKTSLYIYNQTLSDPEILALLEDKARSGLDIRVCQAEKENKEENESGSGNTKKTHYLSAFLKKPYLHAKVFLRDGEEILLGSLNLTENALDNNREITVSLGRNIAIYSQLKKLYFDDCFP